MCGRVAGMGASVRAGNSDRSTNQFGTEISVLINHNPTKITVFGSKSSFSSNNARFLALPVSVSYAVHPPSNRALCVLYSATLSLIAVIGKEQCRTVKL